MSPRVRARQDRALARARLRARGAYLTPHALLRAAELGFHETEVLSCIASPESTYPGHPTYGPGRRLVQRGDCCCVIDASGKAIITVLLRTQAEWEHGVHRRGQLPK